MKQIYVILTGILLVTIMITGCGKWAGNNPVGVTGGDENGYGIIRVPETKGNPNSTVDPQVVGDWTYYATNATWYYTLQSDGDLFIGVEQNSIQVASYQGSFSTNSNQITMRYDGKVFTYTFTIQSNRLILTDTTGRSMTLYKR